VGRGTGVGSTNAATGRSTQATIAGLSDRAGVEEVETDPSGFVEATLVDDGSGLNAGEA